MTVDCSYYESPLGTIAVAVSRGGVSALCFVESWPRVHDDVARRLGLVSFRSSDLGDDLRRQFDAYFAGDVSALDPIEVTIDGTPFQHRVWSALRQVRAGTTISYEELAKSIGSRNSARAVGAANAANPVALIVPCHRVIRADGDLCGYAGGIERKAWLLRHEGTLLNKQQAGRQVIPSRASWYTRRCSSISSSNENSRAIRSRPASPRR